MKLLTVLLLLTALVYTNVSKAQSYKELYSEAFEKLVAEDYETALVKYLELDKENPNNANVKSIIGYCYLQTKHRKAKAIPYLLSVQNDLTVDYDPSSHKTNKAPVEAIQHLGNAYHADYQFDNALKYYSEYKELVEGNDEYTKLILRDIRVTRNAKELYGSPVGMNISALGDNLNTQYPEYRPLLNADETQIVFTSRREGSIGGIQEEGKYREDLYISLFENGKWTDPEPIEELNGEGHEACVYLSPDGKSMYVYEFDGGSDGTIYGSSLEGDKWSEPQRLPSEINSTSWDSHASMSADGRMIAFVSDRPGGKGERDIYLLKKLPNGEWAKAQNIGSVINTEYDEEGPYLHPDGKTLYFSSKGHKSMGGFDVFASEMDAAGNWSEPRNLGYPINTTGEDVFFVPSADGKRAYFSSWRDGGKGDQDIYMIEMLDEVEKTITLYKGCIIDTEGNAFNDVVITMFDAENDDIIGEYRSNPLTGRFIITMPPGSYLLEYEYNGLIASEDLIVKASTGYQEIGRRITKSDIKLEIEKTDYTCDGSQIATNTDKVKTYVAYINGEPLALTPIQVKNKMGVVAGNETTSDNGQFTYIPVDGEPTFYVLDDKLCGDMKAELQTEDGKVLETYTWYVECPVSETKPATLEKFYGYNMKGIDGVSDFNSFINKAAAIYKAKGSLALEFEGSASYVPTKTFSSNKNLAESRTEDGIKAVMDALTNKGVDKNKITFSKKSLVQGPRYKGDYKTGGDKYGKFQYLKVKAN